MGWIASVLAEMTAVEIPKATEYVFTSSIAALLSIAGMLELQLCDVCIREGYFTLSVTAFLAGFSQSCFAGIVAVMNNCSANSLKILERFIEISCMSAVIAGIESLMICNSIPPTFELYEWCYLCMVVAFVWSIVLFLGLAATVAWRIPLS